MAIKSGGVLTIILGLWLAVVPVASGGGVVGSFIPDGVEWGLTIRVLGTEQKQVSGSGPGEMLVPGSLNKLFVTGLVLDKEINLHDRLLLTENGDLYWQGGGNSFLAADDLREAGRKMKESGVGEINGDIIVDDSLFDISGIERKRRGPAYGVPGAVGLDQHTVSVSVLPGKIGDAPVVSIEPPNSEVKFAVSARTVAGGIGKIEISRLDDLTYKVSGNIRAGSPVRAQRFELADPALYAGGVLKTVLAESGVPVKGEVRRGMISGKSGKSFELPGPERGEMLRVMNVHSLNVVADNLFLKAGADISGAPGNVGKGIRVTKEFLAGLTLPVNEVDIHDGSGLSEKDRATASFIAAYLVAAAKKPWADELKNSLPVPGLEGTLRRLPFHDESFRVKSGRLENVYGLAGYGMNALGREVAFAFIMNGPGVGILPNSDQIAGRVLEYIKGGVYEAD